MGNDAAAAERSRRRRFACLSIAPLGVFLALIIGWAVYADRGDTSHLPVPVPSPSPSAGEEFDDTGPVRISTPTIWGYMSESDEIRNGEKIFAILGSLNESTTADGEKTQLVMRIARAPGTSTGVIFYFDPGKFGCSEAICAMDASFDGVQDTVLARALPEYRMLQIYDPEGFVRRLQHTKRFVIEVGMNDLGTEQFSFNTTHLVWDFGRQKANVPAGAASPSSEASSKVDRPGGEIWPPSEPQQPDTTNGR